MIMTQTEKRKTSGDQESFPSVTHDKHGIPIFFKILLKNGDYANARISDANKKLWKNVRTGKNIPHEQVEHWEEFAVGLSGKKITTIN